MGTRPWVMIDLKWKVSDSGRLATGKKHYGDDHIISALYT